jgi:hypothetical protein
MDSQETPQQRSDESLSFVIRKSSKNVFIAKVIILFTLSFLGGYFFAKDGARKYEKGQELTQQEYLARFDEYKGSLLNAKQYDNPALATFVMLIVVSFLIGSYELTALIIGLLIGKLIRR